ncbi:hypothetical protein A3D11_00680 [Candidatus Peribacteria bacterium RIFCSPHIGHO2_02_FULL_49_16]|nr:MAG: hypothetical protein A2880_00475 [Candidatus Peribacteria bacterium RIFCSPHIGHO2_01_FULL_49_38]OGJ59122.1 MAG: hypothetical protein A3D11_00680 [Candidatus Peribacteria bacterium RIFCSPHIGHO2_02_FULL_49_16]
MHSVTSKPIQRNMRVIDVIALVPGAESLFLEYGLHCVRCSLNTVETLEEGCLGHGMNEEDIDDLIGDLNELFFCQPKRPEKITVTKAGAEALAHVLQKEEDVQQNFVMTFDGRGSFCLECGEEKSVEGHVFFHPDVPNMCIVVDDRILRRIGGAVIDVREGRFTLDIPGDEKCCEEKECTCE